MQKGRILRYALSGAMMIATALITSQGAEARVFIGFGFGFPGFVAPPIYAPPPPLVYRPAIVYAPPPVFRPPTPVVYVPPPPPAKHYRRPVRHHRPCRCYGR